MFACEIQLDVKKESRWLGADLIPGKKDMSIDRIIRPGGPPSHSEIAEWIGDEAYTYWMEVIRLIEREYPDIFIPEWLFGGRKHGWSFRYKKNKSFCTLIPEKGRFALLMVFGAEERGEVELLRDKLSAQTRKIYDIAATYHDGKWVLLTVDSDTVIADVRQLLAVKRKPRIPQDL